MSYKAWEDYDYKIQCAYVYPNQLGRKEAYFKGGGHTFHARLVAAIKLRRPIRSGEHVHHINGDCSDDRFENLEVLTPAEHYAKHPRRTGRPCSGCGADVSERTFGCQPCAVRHNAWRAKGKPFIAAHTLRKDNAQWRKVA